MVEVDIVEDIPLQNEAKGNSLHVEHVNFYRRNIMWFTAGKIIGVNLKRFLLFVNLVQTFPDKVQFQVFILINESK